MHRLSGNESTARRKHRGVHRQLPSSRHVFQAPPPPIARRQVAAARRGAAARPRGRENRSHNRRRLAVVRPLELHLHTRPPPPTTNGIPGSVRRVRRGGRAASGRRITTDRPKTRPVVRPSYDRRRLEQRVAKTSPKAAFHIARSVAARICIITSATEPIRFYCALYVHARVIGGASWRPSLGDR